MTSLPNNSPGDGRGHGTFVASIAAGAAPGYAGAAPTAPLVSIDVADDSGMAMTSVEPFPLRRQTAHFAAEVLDGSSARTSSSEPPAYTVCKTARSRGKSAIFSRSWA